MKKTMLAVLVSVVALLLVSNAFALSATAVTVGSDRQSASNPKARLTTDQNVFVTTTVTLTNDGNETLNSLRLNSVTPKLGLSTTDLSVNATFTTTTLAPNATTSVTVNIRVPEKLDAVDSTKFAEKAFNVADLQFAGTGATSGASATANSAVNMQRRNYFEIKDIDICVNDRCKSLSDRGRIDGIRPGDTIDLRVTIKNRYSTIEREDLDINDGVLEFEIDDRDFSENDNVDLSDISSDEEIEESFAFSVDDDVRDGTFKLEIKTFGRDENNALMGEFNTIDLRVERQSHDLTLRRLATTPTVLECGVNRVMRITTTVTNLGKRDENRAAIEVLSDELKIKDRLTGVRLSQDDSRTDTFTVKVADNVKPGTYRVSARTFFDDTAQSDEGTVDVTVPDCTGSTTSTTADSGSGSTQLSADEIRQAQLEAQLAELQAQLAAKQTEPVAPRTTTRTTTPASSLSSFTSSGSYVALLALVVLIVVVLIVVLIVKSSRPRVE
ncbi:hypothetical protein HY641_00885 [Candidatus Woesearchaeota archaeon]|nr:hypothetical protein [Candidatus Woesearchaeota archaeon]